MGELENLIVSFNSVAPIFICLMVGYAVKRSGMVPESIFPHLSKLCFNVLISTSLFYNSYTADFSQAFSVRLMVYLVAVTVLIFALASVIFARVVKDNRVRGVLLQAVYRSNIAVVGIPMLQPLVDENGIAMMSIAIAIMIPLFNVLAVIALENCRGGKVPVRQLLVNIVKNPLVLGSGLGLIFMALHIPLPAAVKQAVRSIGGAGAPLMLITLGATFRFSGLARDAKKLVLGNLLRLVVTPAIVVGGACLLGMDRQETAVALIVAGANLATATFPMALSYDSDYEFASEMIVTSSLLCCATLFVWIFFLRQIGVI